MSTKNASIAYSVCSLTHVLNDRTTVLYHVAHDPNRNTDEKGRLERIIQRRLRRVSSLVSSHPMFGSPAVMSGEVSVVAVTLLLVTIVHWIGVCELSEAERGKERGIERGQGELENTKKKKRYDTERTTVYRRIYSLG